MTNLNTSKLNQVYYVKSNIIYKITSPTVKDNSCPDGGGVNSENVPYITVKWGDLSEGGKTEETNYFLDSLIEVGDEYKNSAFTPSRCDSGITTYYELYKQLCENQIENVIMKYPYMSIDMIKEKLPSFGVPKWMLKDGGYEISNIEEDIQIDFDGELYDDLKENGIEAEIKKQAENIGTKYGKNVTITVTFNEED